MVVVVAGNSDRRLGFRGGRERENIGEGEDECVVWCVCGINHMDDFCKL